MIKKIILFLIISFQYNCLHSQNHDYKWNNKNYEVHNYNSFQKLEFIHEKIQRDKIDYDLSKFSSRSIKRPKIQELSSIKVIKCSLSLMSGKGYIDDLFSCQIDKFKNFNQELYKRFIKPFYLPILTLICCFLLTFSKEHHNYTLRIIKIFVYVFLILVISEIFMRYIQGSLIYLILFLGIPLLSFSLIYTFLINKVNNA